MTPILNHNSDAKMQTFCNPFLQIQNMKTSLDPTPKCYTFLKTSNNPQLESQLRSKILQIFLLPIFCKPTIDYTNTIKDPNPKVISF